MPAPYGVAHSADLHSTSLFRQLRCRLCLNSPLPTSIFPALTALPKPALLLHPPHLSISASPELIPTILLSSSPPDPLTRRSKNHPPPLPLLPPPRQAGQRNLRSLPLRTPLRPRRFRLRHFRFAGVPLLVGGPHLEKGRYRPWDPGILKDVGAGKWISPSIKLFLGGVILKSSFYFCCWCHQEDEHWYLVKDFGPFVNSGHWG